MPVSAQKITDSKDMSWSPERRAAWSKRMKEEKANGTWFKKSKKEVGEAISNGKKASNKKKRLSIARKNGWETRRANGNCDTPEITSTEKDLTRILELLEKYLGYKLTVEEFTEQAIQEKMSRFAAVFNPDKRYLLFGDFKGGDQ
jgi:hypothetical protein